MAFIFTTHNIPKHSIKYNKHFQSEGKKYICELLSIFCTRVNVFTGIMSSDDENDVINKALLRGVRNGSLRNPLWRSFALSTQLLELSYLVVNNNLF